MAKVYDEAIIAALLQNGTVKAAAAAANVSARTIYDRMKDNSFRAAYMEAQTDVIRGAVFSINSKLSEAVDTVAAIMSDPDTNAAVGLQAAQTIINNAAKMADRLAAVESNARAEASPLAAWL